HEGVDAAAVCDRLGELGVLVEPTDQHWIGPPRPALSIGYGLAGESELATAFERIRAVLTSRAPDGRRQARTRPGGRSRKTSASLTSSSWCGELVRQHMAMRRLGAGSENRSRWTPSVAGTGGRTASSGRRVTPTPAATIWRSVSRLVARKPRR